MRVLVTGGLGFTGQAVARTLLAHGHQVVVLSHRTDGDDPGRPTPPGAELARADLRDRTGLAAVMAAGGFEAVCHLAALTRVRDSFADPIGYFDVNVTGTLNLLQALDTERERTGRPARLIFSSSGSVYGRREGTLAEDDPAIPANPYGASKLAAEQLIGYQAAAGRLDAVTLRCFNIAGAGAGQRDDDLSRIIPKTLAVAAGTAARLEINGDGSAVREYTHVLDVAEAFRLSLGALPLDGHWLDGKAKGRHRVFNVGSGQGTTLMDVVEAVRRITGRPVPVEHRPAQPEARILMADSGRIRRELGWRPVHSALDQILRDGWAASQR
jgi:UDP-glucose 4-epimerase